MLCLGMYAFRLPNVARLWHLPSPIASSRTLNIGSLSPLTIGISYKGSAVYFISRDYY